MRSVQPIKELFKEHFVFAIATRGWYSHDPAFSCKDIRDLGSSKGDGEYWIDLGQKGNPLKVYCDMTTDSGIVWNFMSSLTFGGIFRLGKQLINAKYMQVQTILIRTIYILGNRAIMKEMLLFIDWGGGQGDWWASSFSIAKTARKLWKLGGCILRPNIFSSRSTKWVFDVTWR